MTSRLQNTTTEGMVGKMSDKAEIYMDEVDQLFVEARKVAKTLSVKSADALILLVNDRMLELYAPIHPATYKALERKGLYRHGFTTQLAAYVSTVIEGQRRQAEKPARILAAQDAADAYYAVATSDDPEIAHYQSLPYLDSKSSLMYAIRAAYGYTVDAERIYGIMGDGDFIVADAYQAWITECKAKADYEAELAACVRADEVDRLAAEKLATELADEAADDVDNYVPGFAGPLPVRTPATLCRCGCGYPTREDDGLVGGHKLMTPMEAEAHLRKLRAETDVDVLALDAAYQAETDAFYADTDTGDDTGPEPIRREGPGWFQGNRRA